ncbi:MAG TPA: aldehyde-activating protein [Betaproteobacteria bacterium]|nr:aldehyde-activating protein [Betaproteobacteria bacterium]
MYQGGCLCGAIRFEITGKIRRIVYCHCTQCRKAQGSAFATNGVVAADEIELLAGEDMLTGYESSPGQIKYFCRRCGSPIMSKTQAKPGQRRIRLGAIESDIAERPEAHIFVSSKANWETIGADLPQYDAYEPNR